MPKLSFLIPVYNSEKTIAIVIGEIAKAVKTLITPCEYEIVLVDDGSRDHVYELLMALQEQNSCIRPFSLSRNFGQANALMAGLNQITGDFVICLDDDMQTLPSEFPKLYEKLIQGNYDVVYGYYEKKQHSVFRNFGTQLNVLMQKIVLNKENDVNTSSYFIARRFLVDVVKEYDKPFPYLPGLFLQVTNNVASVPIQHSARLEGKSGYSLKKLMDLWLNGFTNFSIKPLRLATVFGIITAFFAFLMIVVLVIYKMLSMDIQEGWTSLIVIVLFVGGVQMFSIGLLGEYVGRIYLSVNKTPQFVIKNYAEKPQEGSQSSEMFDK